MRVRGYAPATPCWAEYVAADPAAATSFYGDLFGWEPGEHFAIEGHAVAGVRQGAPGQPSGWLTYIATEDAAATVAAATDAGGSVLMPPTELGVLGLAAIIADDCGAAFGVWQHGTFHGAELSNQPDTVCWSDVATRDTARTTAFYAKAFGWSDRECVLAEGLAYTEWISGSRVVGGMTVLDENFPADVPPHWRTTFEVADCAAVAARAAGLGALVVLPPMDVVLGVYAQIVDPQGGSFGVIQLVPELREGW